MALGLEFLFEKHCYFISSNTYNYAKVQSSNTYNYAKVQSSSYVRRASPITRNK